MSKKRRIFDIEISDMGEEPVASAPDPSTPARRGPMASAISENASALRDRQAAEAEIRAENDRLAAEFVRLKREGLVTDRVPLDAVVSERLMRDRGPGEDETLEELKTSIREIGLSNPIRVEAREDGRFELVQGMRRLLAYRALHAETGESRFETIPAGIAPLELRVDTVYRRMVDENLIRKDISFAEMATLARRYAEDPAHGCADIGDAVAVLYKSASAVKRSYIRAFAELLRLLEKSLAHPQEIPRNVGVELKRRMEREPDLRRRVVQALQAEPARDAAREVAILRGFSEGLGTGAGDLPAGNEPTPTRTRQAKTTFQVPYPGGVARCSASQGRLELRADVDFSAIERRALERAVAAFLDALERD